jgi:hypothetical protein
MGSQLEATDLQNQFRLFHIGGTVSSKRAKETAEFLPPRAAVPEALLSEGDLALSLTPEEDEAIVALLMRQP